MQREALFCAYIYYDPSRNNEPIYVGKGSENRPWHHLHRTDKSPFPNRLRKMKRHGINPIIGIYTELSEELAFLVEIELISKFGRKDLGKGTLLNLTDGGDGASNPTQEVRNKISEANKDRPKSHAQKEKIRKSMSGKLGKSGKDNPFFGKTHTKESLIKIGEASSTRIYSDDARRNMSESARRRWQKR